MVAVEVHDLRKSYAETDAVNGISFRIEEGEVYALLGHNGAGKSTTVEILEGFRRRSSGTVSVLGMDPAAAGRELRDRIGIVLQTSGVEPELTVLEAVELYGSAYRRRRPTREVLDLVGLDLKKRSRIGTLSGGQRRRLDLALGIVGYPDLLFLDEPTTGFDPAARRMSWRLIEDLCALGTTVLLTTHYLDEAEHLADRVGVLREGLLVAEGTPAQLVGTKTHSTVAFSLIDADPLDLQRLLPEEALVDGHHIQFSTLTPVEQLHEITTWAFERGARLDDLSVARPTLEDVFLGLSDEAEPS